MQTTKEFPLSEKKDREDNQYREYVVTMKVIIQDPEEVCSNKDLSDLTALFASIPQIEPLSITEINVEMASLHEDTNEKASSNRAISRLKWLLSDPKIRKSDENGNRKNQ